MTPARDRCHAQTKKGARCRNPAGPDGLCAVHRHQVAPDPEPAPAPIPDPEPSFANFLDWAEEEANGGAFTPG